MYIVNLYNVKPSCRVAEERSCIEARRWFILTILDTSASGNCCHFYFDKKNYLCKNKFYSKRSTRIDEGLKYDGEFISSPFCHQMNSLF